MGTSASGAGAGGGNPLIPGWIGGGGGGFPLPEPLLNPDPPTALDNGADDNDQENNDGDSSDDVDDNTGQNINFVQQNDDGSTEGNRYRQPRIQFNKFIRSGGTNYEALKNALKGYSRKAAGGTGQLARRMRPAASRIGGFYDVINTVKEQGKQNALVQFNLSSYADKPLSDVLSALSDAIFKDTGKIYEDTQDDSITKHAYSNTVVRICELEGIDLDNLTNDQVEVMVAIFIEETIAQRVINDIGNMLTEKKPDIKILLEIENNIYQIVSGLVRNQIMQDIIITQRGDRTNIETKIENIYRVAFDAMAGLNH